MILPIFVYLCVLTKKNLLSTTFHNIKDGRSRVEIQFFLYFCSFFVMFEVGPAVGKGESTRARRGTMRGPHCHTLLHTSGYGRTG